jgi:phosphoribosyl-AMP cyclohydrolase
MPDLETIHLEESTELLLQFDKRNGILPVIVQENSTNEILMQGYVNQQALTKTIEIGKAVFYSTSRKKLWFKGETSGNTLTINEIFIDCDQDALIYKVTLDNGGSCHTFLSNGQNRKGCFYRRLDTKFMQLTMIAE